MPTTILFPEANCDVYDEFRSLQEQLNLEAELREDENYQDFLNFLDEQYAQMVANEPFEVYDYNDYFPQRFIY